MIDRIIGLRQQYKQLQIIEADIFPSGRRLLSFMLLVRRAACNCERAIADIIFIQFKRPHSFKFRKHRIFRRQSARLLDYLGSGQWVRVSIPTFSSSFNKHHAFSLASAPQAPVIELYIKVRGEARRRSAAVQLHILGRRSVDLASQVCCSKVRPTEVLIKRNFLFEHFHRIAQRFSPQSRCKIS